MQLRQHIGLQHGGGGFGGGARHEGGYDVDNMGYEALQALGDRMGSVVNPGASTHEIERLPTHTFVGRSRSNRSVSSGGGSGGTSSDAINLSDDEDAADASSLSSVAAAAVAAAAAAEPAAEAAEHESCCICMCEFEPGDELRSLPCMHMFHKAEIDKWLATNKKCPICQTAIDTVHE
jgi:hypothetical protein